jgi:NAD(P)H-dependent flavin oxidoreductase YrpB (nitropropane dioxygenase family)
MRSPICDLLGIEYPILAFTHCRDVAIAVSQAGGLGVLGAARKTPEQVDMELTQMDSVLKGKYPYGIDILTPSKTATAGGDVSADWAGVELERQIPAEYIEYRDKLAGDFGLRLPEDWSERQVFAEGAVTTVERAEALADAAFEHPVRFLMSALGPAPESVITRAHDNDAFIGGMCGSVRHAVKHREAGADVVAAIGTEGGGHVGDITTMVLVPEVVDAVGSMPVLAGGGIGRGRQLAAAMALGAAGAWTGSVWLTTVESDVEEPAKEALLAAEASDAQITRQLTGKPSRMIRTKWLQAWEDSGLEPLGMPLQAVLQRPALLGAQEQRVDDVFVSGVGQIVGSMNQIRTTKEVVLSMIEEFAESVESLASIIEEA